MFTIIVATVVILKIWPLAAYFSEGWRRGRVDRRAADTARLLNYADELHIMNMEMDTVRLRPVDPPDKPADIIWFRRPRISHYRHALNRPGAVPVTRYVKLCYSVGPHHAAA